MDKPSSDGDHKLLPVPGRSNRQKYQKILGHEASPNKIQRNRIIKLHVLLICTK